jgi:hypothetical protein
VVSSAAGAALSPLSKPLQDVGMVGVGGLTGGLGSVIGGGSFWSGVRQGIITSGLNHVLHQGVAGIMSGGEIESSDTYAEGAVSYAESAESNPIVGIALRTLMRVFWGAAKQAPKVLARQAPKQAITKTLQTGGHTLNKATLKALRLTKEQGKIAIEGLKRDLGLKPDFHGKILSNGDLVNPKNNQVLGNLYEYLPSP